MIYIYIYIYINHTHIGYCTRVAISWAWAIPEKIQTEAWGPSEGIDMEFPGILEKELRNFSGLDF